MEISQPPLHCDNPCSIVLAKQIQLSMPPVLWEDSMPLTRAESFDKFEAQFLVWPCTEHHHGVPKVWKLRQALFKSKEPNAWYIKILYVVHCVHCSRLEDGAQVSSRAPHCTSCPWRCVPRSHHNHAPLESCFLDVSEKAKNHVQIMFPAAPHPAQLPQFQRPLGSGWGAMPWWTL